MNGHDDAKHYQRDGRQVGGDVGAHGCVINHIEDPDAVLLPMSLLGYTNPEAETALARLLGEPTWQYLVVPTRGYRSSRR